MLARPAAALLALVAVAACSAQDLPTPQAITWTSAATGTAIEGRVYTPPAADAKPLATVIYQKNLSVPRIGQEADEAIIADLLKDGMLVLTLDYLHHDKAVSPTLNADSLALRQALTGKKPTLLADKKVDGNHIFLLAEGFRLARNVVFANDGKRAYAMDIAYPAKPTKPVPLLLEFSCDNAERMGSGSLIFCRDTLLDGAMYAGFAAAMADHPVPPPYKGLDDPMPAVFNRARDAVYTAWTFGRDNDLGGSPVGVIGFSRGSPIAAMAAMNPLFRARAENEDVSEKAMMQQMVGAALVHGNRFDYLDLLPNDPMIPRFKKAWGDPATQPTKWAAHGATYYAGDPKRIAPMFLNTSRKESPEYQDGLAKFDSFLTKRGVPHEYVVDDDDRGHRVTTDPKRLSDIYAFFDKYLKDTK